jgi:RHS repeat-associated protein
MTLSTPFDARSLLASGDTLLGAHAARGRRRACRRACAARRAGGPAAEAALPGGRAGRVGAVTSNPPATQTTQTKVVWRARYEPFGLATPDEDPDADGKLFALDVRFPGQLYDAESGLHDNYLRTYEPATGRYLSADPIGQVGGTNVFVHVLSDPLNLVDRICSPCPVST